MSSLSHIYQEFADTAPTSSNADGEADEGVEDLKLQSFEDGYQAGWDDCAKANSNDGTRIANELGQNILDMSFTFHEALAKVSQELQPMMALITEKLLPEIARETLGAHIVAQINQHVLGDADALIEIVVAPGNETALENFLPPGIANKVSIETDGSLTGAQAYVKNKKNEKKIDIDAVVADIAQVIKAFFHDSQQEKTDG
ncbi:MAG: hypothetical protein WBC93_13550 [Sulfitobacter sp.]